MADQKAVFITGASSGIGRECALHLDHLGFRVFAGVRKHADANALRQVSSKRLTPVIIDVTKPDLIASAAQTVAGAIRSSGLAGLINNAGIARGGPLEFIPIDDLRTQLEVNVIGQIAVTQAFLPFLRRAQGRVINMSSISGRLAIPFIGPYCASKFSLEALTIALRFELKPWKIEVVSIQPGPIDTPIWDKSITSFDKITSDQPQEVKRLYGLKLTSLRQKLQKSAESGISPKEVAKIVTLALTTTRPKTRYLVGRQAKMGAFLNTVLPGKLWDRLILHSRRRHFEN